MRHGGYPPSYYPATSYDAEVISSGGAIFGEAGMGKAAGWGLVVPLHVIDVPISLVTDTLLFPVDAIRVSKERKEHPTHHCTEPPPSTPAGDAEVREGGGR
jgi:uncharacterized protein YceK